MDTTESRPPYEAQTGQPGEIYAYDQPSRPDPSSQGPSGQPAPYTFIQRPPSTFMEAHTPATSYLRLAIFTGICCCWPVGIAAIIFAVRTNDANKRENYTAAKKNSNMSLYLSIASVVCGSIAVAVTISLAITFAAINSRPQL